jgi:hypothetical protein
MGHTMVDSKEHAVIEIAPHDASMAVQRSRRGKTVRRDADSLAEQTRNDKATVPFQSPTVYPMEADSIEWHQFGADVDSQPAGFFSYAAEAIVRLIEQRDEVAGDLLKVLLFALNWPQQGADASTITDLLHAAARYNTWRQRS